VLGRGYEPKDLATGIFVFGPERVPPARTDREGRYSFKGTAPGRYTVEVQRKADTASVPPRVLTLAAGVRATADFRIPRGAAMQGRVLDEEKDRSGMRRSWLRGSSRGTAGPV
jgi:hypothetical protein